MIETHRVEIEGFGTVRLLKVRRGKVKNVWLWTDSGSGLRVTLIADGHKELVCDYFVQEGEVKLPVDDEITITSLRAVVKSEQEGQAQLTINIEYA